MQNCLDCQTERVIEGTFVNSEQGYRNQSSAVFRIERSVQAQIISEFDVGIELDITVRACLACGCTWSSAYPELVRRYALKSNQPNESVASSIDQNKPTSFPKTCISCKNQDVQEGTIMIPAPHEPGTQIH